MKEEKAATYYKTVEHLEARVVGKSLEKSLGMLCFLCPKSMVEPRS